MLGWGSVPDDERSPALARLNAVGPQPVHCLRAAAGAIVGADYENREQRSGAEDRALHAVSRSSRQSRVGGRALASRAVGPRPVQAVRAADQAQRTVSTSLRVVHVRRELDHSRWRSAGGRSDLTLPAHAASGSRVAARGAPLGRQLTARNPAEHLAVHGRIPLAAFAQLTIAGAVLGGLLVAVLNRRSTLPRRVLSRSL